VGVGLSLVLELLETIVIIPWLSSVIVSSLLEI